MAHCPDCDEDGSLVVTAEISTDLVTGDLIYGSLPQWDGNAKVYCRACEWQGLVYETDEEQS